MSTSHPISDITRAHYDQFLKINTEFVHWLAPLDAARLDYILERATYAKQIDEAQAVLIGYPHDVDYPDHENITWLHKNLETFFYIDRIIIDAQAQGKGYGRRLYEDIADFARTRGYPYIACEVNTVPNNPTSHDFHLAMGFTPLGEEI